MQEFFTGVLGVPENLFAFVILPLIIFIARIGEVSVNTIRIIYMLGGRRYTATIMGFFEALIWLVAMRQIFQHLDNWVCYVAYPGGFAAGIFVGMIIEERIAYGKVIMRIITRKDVSSLLGYLAQRQFRYTKVDAEGPAGGETLVFTVLQREQLGGVLGTLREMLPTAFYTIENVKAAGENGTLPVGHSRSNLFTWLRGVIKN